MARSPTRAWIGQIGQLKLHRYHHWRQVLRLRRLSARFHLRPLLRNHSLGIEGFSVESDDHRFGGLDAGDERSLPRAVKLQRHGHRSVSVDPWTDINVDTGSLVDVAPCRVVADL